ncbi:MAG: hypothetical protein CVV25_06060 [Ignavibacteriae bacterium HGW-Ignavibacteriae-4]|nr:MAG: hypothetical protein CVV25_06060 [Ignavibacteriae bacterium HGW-Ignavibacteriae-4]
MKINRISIEYYLVFALVLLTGVLLLNSYLGDPSIYYIFSKNISKGEFLTYNSGEFSSGATSPLWAILLSIPFFISKNIVYAKVFSFIITLVSHLYLIYCLKKINKSTILVLLLYSIISYYTLIFGLMSYEISLLLFAVPLLVLGVIEGNKKHIFLSFMLLPLIRPDSIVLVLVTYIYLVYIRGLDFKSDLLKLVFAILPFGIYILISYSLTGTYSSSSYCRSFALSEGTNTIFGLKYSLSSIFAVVAFPSAFLILLLMGKRKFNTITVISIISTIIYLLVFSFIKPIDENPHRYLVPIFILLSFSIATIYNDLTSISPKLKLILIAILIFIVALIGAKVYKYYNTFSFEQIAEKELIESLNVEIPQNSLILSYEVQNKYYMRNDIQVLSLDGIIDGKVAPYLKTSKMIEFINEYRPDYWIANDAVNYRNYLRNSELFDIYNQETNLNDTVRFENVSFILLKENDVDLGKLANWKKFYKLEYQ